MWQIPTALPFPGRVALLVAAGVVVLGSARPAFPHSCSGGDGSGRRSCQYVDELQKSVAARRSFLVALDANREGGGSAAEKNHAKTAPAPGAEKRSEEGYPSWHAAGSAASERKAVLDGFSVHCLGCHDGKVASDIGVVVRDAPSQRRARVASFSMDHPLGMEYRRYAALGSGFKQAAEGSRLTMVNGRVGCLTCHDPLNPQRGHLAISDRRSALCLTCHDR